MKNQPLVLVLSNADDPELQMLDSIPHLRINSAADLTDAAKAAEVILHWAGPRDLLQTVFLASPSVRWVHSRSAGLDKILFPELVQSPVPLTNGSGVFSQTLGEFALGVILYFAKDFRRMIRNQEAGRWEQFDVDERSPARPSASSATATSAVPLPAASTPWACACSRSSGILPSSPDPLIEKFYQPEALSELLALSDYVVVAAPLTAETHHMIGDAAFAAMKPSAVIINIGRGPGHRPGSHGACAH